MLPNEAMRVNFRECLPIEFSEYSLLQRYRRRNGENRRKYVHECIRAIIAEKNKIIAKANPEASENLVVEELVYVREIDIAVESFYKA
ncbi:hypothetical protein L2E82_14671 [Cichorium intybus]|uniref:Uncharacterized protein n=1 Tax=Cichorium intybus TaxID=13427 RepID=A0ACB9F1A3_CICIN|nr:hypothetical protein L2E82_14671 [Cichorium intybus]